MRVLGLVIGLCVLLLEAILIIRGARCRSLRAFPLLFAYVIYDLGTTSLTGLVAWLRPSSHAYVYWLCYLLSILVEFAVLVEISDHIFQPFPALRNLGRALTLAVTGVFGVIYVLPALVKSQEEMPMVLLDFALRTAVAKAAILALLFLVVRHFALKLGRNVAGLMMGFTIYQGVNIVNFAAAHANGAAVYAPILWVVPPIAYLLCLLVWTVGLWRLAPMPVARTSQPAPTRSAGSIGVGLERYNDTLSRFLHK